MKIKIDYYKSTGKWNRQDFATLPDTTELWDDYFIDLMEESIKGGAIAVVDLAEGEQERLPNKFFKRLFK